jgi:hypothetical protein
LILAGGILATGSLAGAAGCGDCDGDGSAGILDALRMARINLGLVVPTPYESARCDVDGDGDVDVLDALLTAQHAVGMPVTLACIDERPRAQACSAPATVLGLVPVNYELIDADASPAEVTVEVSVDGGVTLFPATQGAGGDPVTGLPTVATPTQYTFSWDSAADVLWGTGVILRVTPSDAGGSGVACTITGIDVVNNAPPAMSGCVLLPASSGFLYTQPDSVVDIPGHWIDPTTGGLTGIPGSPFDRGVAPGVPVNKNMPGLARCNDVLYVANSSYSASICGLRVNPITGALSQVPGSPWSSGHTANWQIAACGRLNLVAQRASSIIIMFTQDPVTGDLTIASGAPLSSVWSVAFHPILDRMYVTSLSSEIQVYEVTAAGSATNVPGSQRLTVGFASAVKFNAAGTLLFTDTSDTSVQVWDVAPVTGVLTERAGSPYVAPGLTETFGLGLDPSGDRLFVGNYTGPFIAVFTGLSTGNLVFQQLLDTGGVMPVCLEVYDGRLYVLHDGADIAVFDIPPGGPITELPGSPFTPAGSAYFMSSLLVWPKAATGTEKVVQYDLDDADGDLIAVQAEYSTDGLTFHPATPGSGGSPTSGLATTPGVPQEYFFAWDWGSDLGPGGAPAAHVRLTPQDGHQSGTPCTVGPVTVP